VVVLPTENAYDIGYEDGCVFAGGTWDADTETCLEASCAYTDSDDDTYDDASFDAGAASVEESPQCFLSGFCTFWGVEAYTGHISSPITLGDECAASFDLGGSLAFEAPLRAPPFTCDDIELLCGALGIEREPCVRGADYYLPYY
jgi:hypothetical protein